MVQRPRGGGLGVAGGPRELVVKGGVGRVLGHTLRGGVEGHGERSPSPRTGRPGNPWTKRARTACRALGRAGGVSSSPVWEPAKPERRGAAAEAGGAPSRDRKPRRRRREARAGRGVRQSGRRPGPAQGSAARGLQAGAWEDDWLGQEAAPHVPLGPPRGGEAAAAGGVPAWRPLRPPRRGGSSGRTMHSGSVVRAAHRSLSGPFSPRKVARAILMQEECNV